MNPFELLVFYVFLHCLEPPSGNPAGGGSGVFYTSFFLLKVA